MLGQKKYCNATNFHGIDMSAQLRGNHGLEKFHRAFMPERHIVVNDVDKLDSPFLDQISHLIDDALDRSADGAVGIECLDPAESAICPASTVGHHSGVNFFFANVTRERVQSAVLVVFLDIEEVIVGPDIQKLGRTGPASDS